MVDTTRIYSKYPDLPFILSGLYCLTMLFFSILNAEIIEVSATTIRVSFYSNVLLLFVLLFSLTIILKLYKEHMARKAYLIYLVTQLLIFIIYQAESSQPLVREATYSFLIWATALGVITLATVIYLLIKSFQIRYQEIKPAFQVISVAILLSLLFPTIVPLISYLTNPIAFEIAALLTGLATLFPGVAILLLHNKLRRKNIANEPTTPQLSNFSFFCSICKQIHQGIPALGSPAPIYYYAISESEREQCAVLTTETCALNETDFFASGCLEIPIQGINDSMSFTVWISLSEKNFTLFQQLLHTKGREDQEPMVGWFSSWIYPFEETETLKARLVFREIGIRPFIELEPTDHPLAIAQREGITEDLARQIIEHYLHQKAT